LLVLFLTAAPAWAQAPATDTPDAETIRLTLRPAAAPVPALKYHLLPELRDIRTGNSVVLYYRAFSPEWASAFRLPAVSKALDSWTEDMRRLPPADLHFLEGAAVLKEMDLGARRSYCEWDMVDRIRKEGIGLLLPDVQSLRLYGSLLSARARFEMAEGKFDRAVYTLQTGFKLGHDVGDAPTLIQSLVGIALTTNMLVQTEELIQTPGSPNLYWALTQLPSPYVSLRKGYEGEQLLLDAYLPELREMLVSGKFRPMSQGEIQALAERVGHQLEEFQLTPRHYNWEARLAWAALAAQSYPQAKRWLHTQGLNDQQIEAMPVLQTSLLFELYNYDRLFDEFRKWGTLPYRQAAPGQARAEMDLKRNKAAGPSTGTVLATLLLPAVQKVQLASVRLDRRIAALRCIEAVRMYAADHGGKLPARLGDITEVPVPADPLTGRPFEYTTAGNQATLFLPPPAGETPGPHNTLRYQLTLQGQAPRGKR
jgi:hypothetical protein